MKKTLLYLLFVVNTCYAQQKPKSNRVQPSAARETRTSDAKSQSRLKSNVDESRTGPETLPPDAIKVVASAELLKELRTWDKKIWFFTSKTNPLRSLEELDGNYVEIGVNSAADMNFLADKARTFIYLALGKFKDGIRSTGGNLSTVFSGTRHPPRLFITWSSLAKDLPGSVCIEFVESLRETTEATLEGAPTPVPGGTPSPTPTPTSTATATPK